MPTAGKGIMEMKLCTKIVIRDPACKSILIRKQFCLHVNNKNVPQAIHYEADHKCVLISECKHLER